MNDLSFIGLITKLWIKVLLKLNLLNKFNFIITPFKHSNLLIPIQNGIGYDHFYEKEKWMGFLLEKLIPKYCLKNYFIDVGVNIGQTLIKVKAHDSQVHYMGFEPNPNCLLYLHKLIQINQFKNTTIYPCALSNKDAVLDLEFYHRTLTDSSASIIPNYRTKIDSIKVVGLTWDTIFQENDIKPGIIKIDVEGSEHLVMSTLAGIVSQHKPIVICEVLPVYHYKNKERLNAQLLLEEILKSLDYVIVRIGINGEIEHVQEIGIHGDIEKVNYVFYPRGEIIF